MTQILPDGVTLRPPTLDDVPAILAVVHASDIASVGEADFTADEVVEILTAPNHDRARDSWVAVDASDHIIAWAYIFNPLNTRRDNFDAYAHPELGPGVQPALVQRVVARIAERAREAGLPARTARTGAVASEEAYLGLLRSAGFGFVKRYARMRRELGSDEPAPVAPPRVVVRPVRPDDEAEMRAFHEVLDVAFQDIPDYQPSTYEQYRQRLAALPSIEWDEWFVAEVDGEIAAILQSEGDEPDEGWVKYLGVRADHRGLGLGRLLLLTAFHAYAGKGRRAAGLGVDMTNPTGAYRLYKSVGMHSVYESDVYEREIVAA